MCFAPLSPSATLLEVVEPQSVAACSRITATSDDPPPGATNSTWYADQPTARLHHPCCTLVSDQLSILLGSTSCHHRFPRLYAMAPMAVMAPISLWDWTIHSEARQFNKRRHVKNYCEQWRDYATFILMAMGNVRGEIAPFLEIPVGDTIIR